MADRVPEETFADVEWEHVQPSRRSLAVEHLVAVAGVLAVGLLYLYDLQRRQVHLVVSWRLDTIDWVFLVCLVLLVAYVGTPLSRRIDSVQGILGSLRSRPSSLVATSYLGLVGLAGLVSPAVAPSVSYSVYQFNPPLGFSTREHYRCLGVTAGGALDEICYGSWRYPLGTGRLGERVELLMAAGARPALYVTVIGAVVVLPVAIGVGIVAGLRGGRIDKLLMSYVDLQLCLPAILVYFVAYMTFGPSMLLLLFAFALVSWGGIARLVRSEVIQRRERGHVVVARSLGASEFYVAKRHILPNVTNTVIPAAAHFLALLILYEAGIAFIGFYEASITSWGSMISESINAEVAGPHRRNASIPAHKIWWLSTFPALALMGTMVSLKIVGDGLRDALDPQGDDR